MKRLFVLSFVKAALKEASQCNTISTEILEWIQVELEDVVAYAAAHGERTAAGKLLPPPGRYMTALAPVEALTGANPPERVCRMAKEWRDTTLAEKHVHLDALLKGWLALSISDKQEVLQELYTSVPGDSQEPQTAASDTPAKPKEVAESRVAPQAIPPAVPPGTADDFGEL